MSLSEGDYYNQKGNWPCKIKLEELKPQEQVTSKFVCNNEALHDKINVTLRSRLQEGQGHGKVKFSAKDAYMLTIPGNCGVIPME